MKNIVAALSVLVVCFIGIRSFGVALPLHQDEYKWPDIVNPAHVSETEIPHPPLSQFIYQTGGAVVGYDVHFRYIPLFFGTLNVLLLFIFLRGRFDTAVALVGASLFTISFYSILASLMVDTDGQILPFFFLIALIAFDRIQKHTIYSAQWLFWCAVLASAVLLGFLVKLSFILAAAALAADYLWEKKKILAWSDVLKYAGWAALSAVVGGVLLVTAHYAFSFFNLSFALEYWKHFWNTDRNIFQTGIQVVKAILYTSPLLIVPALFVRGADFIKLRVFGFFLLFGMLFYTVVFDFSIGALDRYLQFVIIPLCALSAVALTRALENKRFILWPLILGSVLAMFIFMLQLLPHSVPPLHPKAEWIGRIFSFNWTFLYPFSGGSGPLGFYVSFLFMGVSWMSAGLLALWALWKPQMRTVAFLVLIPLGLVYNGVFAEEYLSGKINGFTPGLVTNAVRFIAESPDIKKVVVYNDNGGNEVKEVGKYEKRLYTSPQFPVAEKVKTINAFAGHYLVIDVPKIDPNSVFAAYFAGCKVVYQNTERAMSATVYDCRNAPAARL